MNEPAMTIPEQADIVKRLRDWEDYEPAKMFGGEILKDTKEAADEIERLRAELKAEEEIVYACMNKLKEASLVGVERALQPLRAREEIAQEVAKIVDEPPFHGALAACDYMGDEAADDLRKAITRALSRTAGQEWRDISSAPKDGTRVDLWRVFKAGRTKPYLPARVPNVYWLVDMQRWHCDNHYAHNEDFSHWMPLPAPPVAKPLLAEKRTP